MDKIYEIYERYSAYEFEEILDFYANYDYSQYDGIKNAAAISIRINAIQLKNLNGW